MKINEIRQGEILAKKDYLNIISDAELKVLNIIVGRSTFIYILKKGKEYFLISFSESFSTYKIEIFENLKYMKEINYQDENVCFFNIRTSQVNSIYADHSSCSLYTGLKYLTNNNVNKEF